MTHLQSIYPVGHSFGPGINIIQPSLVNVVFLSNKHYLAIYIYIDHDEQYEQLANSYFYKILVIDTAKNLLLYIEVFDYCAQLVKPLIHMPESWERIGK